MDVSGYYDLVKKIARSIKRPSSIHLDDLIQAGMIGLLDAAKKYRSAFGASFRTYAGPRIRGAIIDSLRALDWLPRGMRKNLRKIEAAVSKLEQVHGRSPTEEEVARYIGVSLAQYRQMIRDTAGHQLVYYEDFEFALVEYFGDESLDPLRVMIETVDKKELVDAISKLPPREQLVLYLYYDKQMKETQIGEVMHLTESRISQLKRQAINRLRKSLGVRVQED